MLDENCVSRWEPYLTDMGGLGQGLLHIRKDQDLLATAVREHGDE